MSNQHPNSPSYEIASGNTGDKTEDSFADHCQALLNADSDSHETALRQPLAEARANALRVAAQKHAASRVATPNRAHGLFAAMAAFMRVKPVAAAAFLCLVVVTAPFAFNLMTGSAGHSPSGLSLEAAIDQNVSPEELPLLLEERGVELLEMLDILLAMNNQDIG